MRKVRVLNVEPEGFSERAKETWSLFSDYTTATWEEHRRNPSKFSDTNVLIIRLGNYINSEVLSAFPNLMYLVSATTGHDHIDLIELKKRSIELISLRNEKKFLDTIPSTAEHTFGLLLSLIRRIPASYNSVRKGKWDRMSFKGYELKNKTLGIIGLGRLGRMVASYGKAFGMRITYHDPFVHCKKYTKASSLNELMLSSDIISVHVHADETTSNLINKEALSSVKKGALIINTSRGSIVDEQQIIKCLRSKQLAGYATDVLQYENMDVKRSLIWINKDKHNIIITPHIGGATWDAMWACEEHLARVAKGKITE